MDIRPWLQDLYAPSILVASTPAAEAVVQVKNGLGLVDLLRPYSSVYQLNVPVRVGEASVRVQDLRIRFYDAATLYQPPPEVMEEHLQEVLNAAAQRHARLEPVPDLLQRFMSDNPPDMRELTPWFTAYRSEFLRLLRFGDHETLDYPFACVYAIPADVVNPASHFDTLVAQLVMPPLMQQDVMYTVRDKDFPRHYLLLLDVAAGMSEKRALENLTAIRRLYGEAHCSLLRINSGNGDRVHSGAPVDLFARYQHACLPSGGAGEPLARPPAPPGGMGAYLTVQDLDGVGSFVRDFVSKTVLPKLEERIARLNASITATRRGLRNRLNRFWKGTAEDRQTDRPYPWHSVEGQMRQLGDLAFLLRQYAFAESIYRLAAQDYLGEGNSKWYAGVEEMIGLCTVLGEPADPIAAVLLQNDPMKYFMRAYENYIKPPAAVLGAAAAVVTSANGPGGATATVATGSAAQLLPAAVAASKIGRMLATRVILLGAAVQSAAGRHRATSDALMRAQSEEENARAGLLLEQSAYSMLYVRPPLVRKFAFQMVLAGIRYICCGQKRIAIHAYRQVLSLYLGKKWKYIEEHLHAVLGAQCVEYGDKERALWHFSSLLDCAHRPPAQQNTNVAQFLNLLAGIRDQLAITQDGASLVDRLPLPVVNRHDVRVLCSDSACYAGPAARTVPDSTWIKMEACCTSGSNNWLVDGGFKQERDHEEYTMCVCGEELGVQVEFRNPLAVKLKVSNVRLICSFTPEDDTSAAGPGAGAAGQAASTAERRSGGGGSGGVLLTGGVHPLLPGQSPVALTAQPGSEYVTVSEAQLTLHPGEAMVEVLRVLPHTPGWLRITGVTWTLNGVAHGRITFDVKGRRRKRPKGTRPGQLKHYPPHRRLLFQVLPTMPRLELLSDPLPPALYSGELCRVIMRIRNGGGLPLRSLALVVGHQEAVCPATDANRDKPPLESLTDPREVVQRSKVPPSMRGSFQLYRLWPGRELAPGEVLEWPLWLHPRGVGTLKLPLVWYGEPAVSGSKGGMRHRTLRICGSVSVQPLLAARPTVWPSPTQLSHYLLRLGIDNSKEGERVVLQQVAAVTAPPLSSGANNSTAVTLASGPGTSGWSISLLGSQSSSAAGAATEPPPLTSMSSSAAAPPAGESAAAGAVVLAALPRSLPLAVPLQPAESASLFLQLVAPQNQKEASSAAAVAREVEMADPWTAGAAPGPSPNGVATPAAPEDPSTATTATAVAASVESSVAQAEEALRSIAIADSGVAGTSSRLPYVDGSDTDLQRLNLFGPGVFAHFYWRGRRGMMATIGAAATASAGASAAAAAPTGAGLLGTVPPPSRGASATPPHVPPSPLSPSHTGLGGLPHLQPGIGGGGVLGPGTGLHGAVHHPQPHIHAHAHVHAHTHPHSQQQQQQLNSSLPRGSPYGGSTGGMVPPGPANFTNAQGTPGGAGVGVGRLLAPAWGPIAAGVAAGPLAQATMPGSSGPGRPGQLVPLADPPLDLLVLWHVASSTRTGPHQGQQRIGLCRPYDQQTGRDLSGCLQAQTTPIRMLLMGPNGASSAASSAGSAGPVVRHDFRRSSLAVVPLRLLVRNNMGVEARLQVEVGDGWQCTDAPNSWQASTAIMGSSPSANLGSTGQMGLGGSGATAASAAGAIYAGPTGGSLPAGPVSAGPTGGSNAQGGGLSSGLSLSSSMMSITYQAGLPPCPEFCWVGPTSVVVPRVEPGGEVKVPLAVAVFRPGAYCVTGYRCTAYMESIGAVEVQLGEPLCFRVES